MYRKKNRVRYYPWFQASIGDLGTYFPRIRGDYHISKNNKDNVYETLTVP